MNKRMRPSLISYLALICVFYSNPIHSQVLSPQADFSVDAKIIKVVEEHGNRFCHVALEMKNNSADEIQYRSYSCSWQEFFSINTIEAQVVVNFCDKNFPKTIVLQAQETDTQTLIIKLNKGCEEDVNFKIAMDLIEVISGEKLSDSGILYWSEELTAPCH